MSHSKVGRGGGVRLEEGAWGLSLRKVVMQVARVGTGPVQVTCSRGRGDNSSVPRLAGTRASSGCRTFALSGG